MYWLIDLFLAMLFLSTVIGCVKNGFIKAFFSCFKAVLALIVARLFGPALGRILENAFIKNKITASVLQKLEALIEKSGLASFDVEALLEELPESFRTLLSLCGTDVTAIAAGFSDTVSAENVESLAESVAAPISALIANGVAYIAIFLAALVLLSLLVLVLDGIFKLPLLRSVNRFLGLVFGVVSGFVYVCLLSHAVTLIVNVLLTLNVDVPHEDMIGNTWLYAHLHNIDLMGWLRDIATQF